MLPNTPLFPPSATEIAREVDLLYLVLVAGTIFFSLLIAFLAVGFAVKFRRRSPNEIGTTEELPTALLEISWSGIPFLIMMVLFGWGAKIYYHAHKPPADAVDYWVTGRQWMWKIQHPDGNREINELHIPVGRSVRLNMISEDVLHSFYVPAFRVKTDVLPARVSTMWFQPDRVGTYHLFCAEYCGAEHSKMGGRVYVMTPQDYEAWLSGVRPSEGPALTGDALFASMACNTCHRPDSHARAPQLAGLFGTKVQLQDGSSVIADDAYLRESILSPQAKITNGFQPIMPSFKSQLSEEQVVELIKYIKSLKPAAGVPAEPVKKASL